MEQRFGKRNLLEPGSYTELFFLDEPTALAAGHRPCAQCRKGNFNAFVEAWHRVRLTEILASEIDAVLDKERRERRHQIAVTNELVNGLIVQRIGDQTFFLIYGDAAYPWSFSGYGAPSAIEHLGDEVSVVTLPSMWRVLRAGYEFTVHPTARSASQSASSSDSSIW